MLKYHLPLLFSIIYAVSAVDLDMYKIFIFFDTDENNIISQDEWRSGFEKKWIFILPYLIMNISLWFFLIFIFPHKINIKKTIKSYVCTLEGGENYTETNLLWNSKFSFSCQNSNFLLKNSMKKYHKITCPFVSKIN